MKLNDKGMAKILAASTGKLRITLAQRVEANRHQWSERNDVIIAAIIEELDTRR